MPSRSETTTGGRSAEERVTVLRMTCPHCGKHMRYHERNAGAEVACPGCSGAVVLRRADNGGTETTTAASVVEHVAVLPAPAHGLHFNPRTAAELAGAIGSAVSQALSQRPSDAEVISAALQLSGDQIAQAVAQQCAAVFQQFQQQQQSDLQSIRQLLQETETQRHVLRDQHGAIQEERKAMVAEHSAMLAQLQAAQKEHAINLSEMVSAAKQAIGQLARPTPTEGPAAVRESLKAMQEWMTSLAAELRQSLERGVQALWHKFETQSRAQSEALREAVGALPGRLGQQIESQSRAQAEALREAVGALPGQLAQQIEQSTAGIAQAAQTIIAQLERARADYAEAAQQHNREWAAVQKAALEQLGEIAAIIARDAQEVRQQMLAAGDAQAAAVAQLTEHLAQVQSAGEESAQRQLRTFAAGAEQAAAGIGQRLGESLAAQIDRAAEHFDKALASGRELVGAVVDAQQKAGQQVQLLSDLVAGQGRLEQVQQSLAYNLELATRANEFKQVLKGIDQGLYALKAALEHLRVRVINTAQAAAADEPANKPGLGKRLLRGLGINKETDV